jgi:hypothetical protein
MAVTGTGPAVASAARDDDGRPAAQGSDGAGGYRAADGGRVVGGEQSPGGEHAHQRIGGRPLVDELEVTPPWADPGLRWTFSVSAATPSWRSAAY